jgi:hypothetical protein
MPNLKAHQADQVVEVVWQGLVVVEQIATKPGAVEVADIAGAEVAFAIVVEVRA